MAALLGMTMDNRRVERHRPWSRIIVTRDEWDMAADQLAHGHWTLLGLWGEADAIHLAFFDNEVREIGVISLDCHGSFPSIGMRHPPAIRLERAISDLF